MPIDVKLDALASVNERQRTAQRLANLEAGQNDQNRTVNMILPATSVVAGAGITTLAGPYLNVGTGSILEIAFHLVIETEVNANLNMDFTLSGYAAIPAAGLTVLGSASSYVITEAASSPDRTARTISGVTVTRGTVGGSGTLVDLPPTPALTQWNGPAGLLQFRALLNNSGTAGTTAIVRNKGWIFVSVRS